MVNGGQEEKLQAIANKEPSELLQEEWIELICTHCQFYHPNEEEKLECAGFKILKKMALNGEIDLKKILEVAKSINSKEKE